MSLKRGQSGWRSSGSEEKRLIKFLKVISSLGGGGGVHANTALFKREGGGKKDSCCTEAVSIVTF